MKKLIFVALLVLELGAQAAPVALDLHGVSVPELSELVFKNILKRDYLLGQGINGADPKITLSVAAIEPAEVLPLLSRTLGEFGIALDGSGSVIRVYRASQQALEVDCPTCAAKAQAVADRQGVQPVERLAVSPDVIRAYRPKGKSVEFLSAVAKLAGASVLDAKGSSDVLLFGGTAEIVERVEKLLSDVDTVTPGMTIRAALVEFSENRGEARSLQNVLTLLAGRLGMTYVAGAPLVNGVSYTGSKLQTALTAIEGDNRFRYVAEPTLRVADGGKARLVVGSEVPTRGALVVDKNGNAVQGVEYRTSGVVINVEPKRIGDVVSVRVDQQISSFASTTTSNIDSPTLLKRSSETTVQAKPGELILLAGMDETRESDTRSGFSFLPSWAHGVSSDKSRSQLVLMLEVLPDS